MIPEWAKKYQKPGTSIKRIGNNYYLYRATSRWNSEKGYPESIQTYIGKITETGVITGKVIINVHETEARLLSDLIGGLPEALGKLIVLKIKDDWLYTKTDKKQISQLKKRGLYDNGKVIFQHF